MQLQLDDLALFTRIAELGTLSAVARERNVPVSQVSRSLTRLEAVCGARLLHRSTHGLSLTDEGDTLLAYSRRLLETSAELAAELHSKSRGPSGWVRVSVSVVVAEMLIVPSLPDLCQRYPQLRIDICADDRLVDMARDGIDIAIRTGQAGSDKLVARQIGHFGRTLVASPSYLQRFGRPLSVSDLDAHRLIAHSTNPKLNRWPVRGREPDAAYLVRPHARSDNAALLLALAREGVGIARVWDALAERFIRRGELVALLQDELEAQRLPIFAVVLQERHRLPKIRACIDYWAEWLAQQQMAAT
ncbi:LysR family transcriptional regulator [Accumulibacter sp.]|uniref:LysR family transcriptional regulator n=1 Tax=Accumulibacter sp. TaxID=2053492 RepID=UPI002D164782|nr:LysR family transcriptional regulator [Accumulibacter sp.]HNE41197.1 LysR family transcriptional regulator [Accumulibacter sp.]